VVYCVRFTAVVLSATPPYYRCRAVKDKLPGPVVTSAIHNRKSVSASDLRLSDATVT